MSYDLRPVVAAPAGSGACVAGWAAVGERIEQALVATGGKTVVVEAYVGVDIAEIVDGLTAVLAPALVVDATDVLRPVAELDTLVAPYLGGEDPLFGYLSPLDLPEFLDPGAVERVRERIETADGPVLVVGSGASHIDPGDVGVMADLARWEAQQRQRRHEIGNLGAGNSDAPARVLYKRSYFVDWRVCDRWKAARFDRFDFFLDTHTPDEPLLVDGQAVRDALSHTTRRPFRVVPFFDPGPWGGHWMERVCDLDTTNAPNHAWCFDCVPEENSLLLGFGEHVVELPSLDLVLTQAKALLGEPVHARFGTEFPIRFDFLDTMGGGNLSLQVHPVTEYIKSHFGVPYTQDESYYILDAGPNSSVYLGVKSGIEPAAMLADLRAAQAGGPAFDAERYINRWPARAHDHFLIPAGTIHCSGADTMVLEISATPYIFTFKLWDWGRTRTRRRAPADQHRPGRGGHRLGPRHRMGGTRTGRPSRTGRRG